MTSFLPFDSKGLKLRAVRLDLLQAPQESLLDLGEAAIAIPHLMAEYEIAELSTLITSLPAGA